MSPKTQRSARLWRCPPAAASQLSPQLIDSIRRYLVLVEEGAAAIPRRGRGADWKAVARAVGVSEPELERLKPSIRPIFQAVWARCAIAEKLRSTGSLKAEVPPAALPPASFRAAFDRQIREHGDTIYSLHARLAARGVRISRSTLAIWRRGGKTPQNEASLRVLAAIEVLYELPEGYFASKRSRVPKAIARKPIEGVERAEQRRLSWHLPDDFHDRSPSERAEILAWVRNVILSGATDYRRYQAAALQHRYGLQFPGLLEKLGLIHSGPPRAYSRQSLRAPSELADEMEAFVRFKTATLTPTGYRRHGLWGAETAAQRIEHLGLVFGALGADPNGPNAGRGVAAEALSFAMLAFPAVWDWYVQWRERRRGFFTAWEVDLLNIGAALTRAETGWLRQTPKLVERLALVPGLIEPLDRERALADWSAHCELAHRHCLARLKEIQRVARIHRDSFEPILVVLDAESPLAEYKKIPDEILRRMPDARRHPRAAAEATRAFLMLRFGLHTGLRQRNLRELLVTRKGDLPRSDRVLTGLRRGELRWSEKDQGWEVYIPAVAFKNATSSFFGSRPYRLLLPDLGRLYEILERYLGQPRDLLLAGAPDPGTFFVKSMKRTSQTAEYTSAQFYEAWRLAVQRYGIYNPYTRRGAIAGLLPHGPHNVRDVLATHILKQTGSYEQASYAIQDTPEMVAKHYGRFLPHDKASLAAQVLNQVWG